MKRSTFVPGHEHKPPVPVWKTRPWSKDTLAENDPARDPDAKIE